MKRSRRVRRILPVAVALLAAAVVGGLGAGWLWLRESVPDLSGRFSVSGLRRPLEIVRDPNGVPRVFAASEADALFGLGFVHAQDRLWQMEMNRRIAAGRLAEVLGPEALSTDRFLRGLGFARLAEAAVARLPARERRLLDSYVRGVNAWLDVRTGPLPPEFLLLGFEPEPWRAADSAGWTRVMALQLESGWADDLMRYRLSATLSPDRVLDLFPPYRADKPRGVAPRPATTAGIASGGGGATPLATSDRTSSGSGPRGPALPVVARRLLPAAGGGGLGSNSWVVAGSRTDTGMPILANDPHLGLDAPAIWYLAHLEWPGGRVIGATFAGMPGVVLGHNGRIAWGFTNTGPDSQDLFLERLVGDRRYLAPGGDRPLSVRREVAGVRGAPPVTFRIRETRHGPVLDDLLDEALAPDGHAFALAWPALREDDATLEAALRISSAGDWPGFLDALRRFHAPQQNISYADVAGNIGFVAPGRIPVRATMVDGGENGDAGTVGERPGTLPRPGWLAEADWRGWVPFEDLPQVFNPEAGIIATANHAVADPDAPHPISFDWAPGYRAERIHGRLLPPGRHGMTDSLALQLDSTSEYARALLPFLINATRGRDLGERARSALGLLASWDGAMDRDRPEPLLFHAWITDFGRRITADEPDLPGDEAWERRGAFLHRVLETRPVWCDDPGTGPVEGCAEMLRTSLDAALSRLGERLGGDPSTWRWGDEHPAVSTHRPLGATPIGWFFNQSGPVSGSRYAPNAFAADASSDAHLFPANAGPGFRAIYDLADLDRSWFVISTGQSGNPFSRHYDDFAGRWRAGGYVTIPSGRAGAGARDRILLRPR